MKNQFSVAALLLAGSLSVLASPIDLSGKGYVTYGDANSYSLPLNGLEVMSGPGQIDIYTKLGLHAAGQLGNSQSGMDDAFETPTANNIDSFRMASDGSNDPGGSISQGAWDRVNGWWDATLAALDDKLDLLRHSIVFFFANNETGSGTSDNLAAWARVEVTKISDGTVLGRFDMTNDVDHGGQGYGPPPAGGGVSMGDPTAYLSNNAEPFVSDFVMSGGNVCLNSSGALVDCNDPGVAINKEHNLGGDRAAYAIVVPELDALIASLVSGPGADLNNFAIHVNYRLGCGPELTQSGGGGFPTVTARNKTSCDDSYALNGGDEKVFLGTQLLPGNDVPEPGTLTLLGLAVGVLVFTQRRRYNVA